MQRCNGVEGGMVLEQKNNQLLRRELVWLLEMDAVRNLPEKGTSCF